jgi:hypothetical protein
MNLSYIFPGLVYLALSTQVSLAADTADAIYHNGTILTINDARPTAEAVAVKDGRRRPTSSRLLIKIQRRLI